MFGFSPGLTVLLIVAFFLLIYRGWKSYQDGYFGEFLFRLLRTFLFVLAANFIMWMMDI
ncbi:hypothetical protein Marpi_1462 [Marinitoga piezophila KA3]|uniref:Uncharacterized protein n=1 Tax=Marinitoga piezophila (strain DSM 14283 / JCM 11233 / KA3) TaxID=443254 RepID=H2J442_MARPK|nr:MULTISPECIES: hypothetical protein [Marinitoga]AEX85857.1 hypothetical protein Marpi_1462 [Marinitoga piezophila KA3]